MKQSLYAIALLCLGVVTTYAQNASDLTLEKTITLPAGSGKFDHLAYDEKAGRLFIAGSSAHEVLVVDAKSGKVLETIARLGKPHGLAWVPESGRLFVADGSMGSLNVYEGSPFTLVNTIKLSDDADDMVYDEVGKTLYVGHGGSDASTPARVAVIDTAKLDLVANLPVQSHPEALEIDSKGRRVFVNVADSNEIAVIDADKHVIFQKWPLKRAGHNVPLAYDDSSAALLVGCRAPARILVVDTHSGKEVADTASSVGADDLFFDAATQAAYLVAGSGSVDLFHLNSNKTLDPLGSVKTAPGAKTGLFVAKLSTLFIAVPETSGQSAEVLVFSTKK